MRPAFRLSLALAMLALFMVGLHVPLAGVSPMGRLLDPARGLYYTARAAHHAEAASASLPGLDGPVTILRDDRGVPHIFATTDRDVIRASGYVTAQDRLFQLDFIPRVAAGRLSEILGSGLVNTDRFLRQTGMEWGAQRTLAALQAANDPLLEIMQWYAEGINAYLDGLDEADLPFESRLLGYRPDRYTALHALRLQQYMTFDLTYRTDDAAYAALKAALPDSVYDWLYPEHMDVYVPIIPPRGLTEAPDKRSATKEGNDAIAALMDRWAKASVGLAEGFVEGKGSNNWAVFGDRSATGSPILAGDMHLKLTLPAIWYELHLVTPEMNTYGVAVPGSPLPIEAFNDHVAWAFTNTGSDQIDHYRLALTPDRKGYLLDGQPRAFELRMDTIRVKDGPPVYDTLRYSHWGPVLMDQDEAIAMRWVAHEPQSTLDALWGMNHATDYASFERALRKWDSPMQNILVADNDTIAIRSTGYLPLRSTGTGAGLLDGTTAAATWRGRVPFDELPHAINPAQGFLASTNQQPTNATYPYYLGHDWRAAYRSLRIDSLLRGRRSHSVEDLKAYQADVHAIQRDLFVPLLAPLTLTGRAETVCAMLLEWDGDTGVNRSEPLVMEVFLATLRRLTWDESVFEGRRKPSESRLYLLLRDRPDDAFLDIQTTPVQEDAAALLTRALEDTAVHLADRYGWDPAAWRWGDHHVLEVQHLTQTPALKALWRGGIEYPGFAETLSPAGSRTTTHSASWRVVVDFSQSPPQGYGIYPGGQSGNPFSRLYDRHLADFVNFRHYMLYKPATPEALDPAAISQRLTLTPE